MQLCHSGVDVYVIGRLHTKAPNVKTTIVVDRSFPFCDQEVLSVHCAQGPLPRKMVKFNPGLNQISSKVFLSKNMKLELTKYCLAFTPRYSNNNTTQLTQLLLVLHTVVQSLDNNIQSDMIYLNFAKALDTIDHSALLAKQRFYGVKGQLFCWFKDYLTEHTQRVVLENAASHWSPVTSGVPQGSILGPLLFTLFINDLLDKAAYGVKVALYTNDTKLYRNVSSAEHCDLIQDTLSNMHIWLQHNNIRFNTSKCKVLTVTRRKTPIAFDYTLDGTAMTPGFSLL